MIRWLVMDSVGNELCTLDDPWEAADFAVALGDCDVMMVQEPDRLPGVEYL